MNIVKKHNRFHFSLFHSLYSIFISNEKNKKKKIKKIKKICFSFVFRIVFRVYENVEMCFF